MAAKDSASELVVITRLDRVIQYAAAARVKCQSGGPGLPVKPGDDNLCLMQPPPARRM
jgi:hypothetical protein